MTPAAHLEKVRRLELPLSRSNLARLYLIVFTVFYFADVCLRASSKFFWYDEILTLYFARLPNIPTLWTALHSGLESNPPGFHLLTKAVEGLFGEGFIATRLPEIVAFWAMCLCLFKFVERRAGLTAGVIAMTVPMLTGAYFYAYEARPLIIVAALGAFALYCWDNALGVKRDGRWLFAFGFALFAALMMHCYALLLLVPFGLSEVVRDLRNKRVNWRFWMALTLPLVPALILYIPLLRAFSHASKGTIFSVIFPPVWPEVLRFYSFLLLPCSAILLLSLCLFALSYAARAPSTPAEEFRYRFSWDDALIVAGFAALPAFGVVLAQAVHSVYFGRYFLSALIGFCVPFAILAGAARTRSWVGPVVAGLLIFSLTLNFVRLVRHRMHGEGEILGEPSTSLRLSTTPGHPLDLYPLIEAIPQNGLPIAVLEPLDYLYLLQYAPHDINSRLYYIHSSEADASFRGFRDFLPLSPVKYYPVEVARDFMRHHPEFYLFSDTGNSEEFYRISKQADILSYWCIHTHYLTLMQAKQPGEAPHPGALP